MWSLQQRSRKVSWRYQLWYCKYRYWKLIAHISLCRLTAANMRLHLEWSILVIICCNKMRNIPTQRKLCTISYKTSYTLKKICCILGSTPERKMTNSLWGIQITQIFYYIEKNLLFHLWSVDGLGCFIHVIDIDSIQGDGIAFIFILNCSIVVLLVSMRS